MAKIITFSRFFPSYHYKAGQPTYFVEKIHNSIYDDTMGVPFELGEQLGLIETNEVKHHTIRAGQRFKVGDWFKPVVWGTDINPKSGRRGPYHSKQIQFAPEIQVKKTWEFEMDTNGIYSINGKYFGMDDESEEERLALNDGFNYTADLFQWLMKDWNKPNEFIGQIICWNENITY